MLYSQGSPVSLPSATATDRLRMAPPGLTSETVMPHSIIDRLAQGRFTFLEADPREIRQVMPEADRILPEPLPIFLEDEEQSPWSGFPILLSPKLQVLEETLADYLRAEEEAQSAYHKRQSFDSRSYASRWERYRAQLGTVLENVTLASHGGDYPAVFWLFHSLAVSRYLYELPRRLRRQDLNLGRDHGDAIKYTVFKKWSERVMTLNREIAAGLAEEMVAGAETLFPALLAAMCDNVLIFTEDYVSPDLSQLGSYFSGYLREDGRDLRQRLGKLAEWQSKNLAGDEVLNSAVAHLLGADPEGDSRALLHRSGWITFLSHHVTYSPSHLLTSPQIEIWERLLERLKQFEILTAVRRMLVPMELRDGVLVSRDRGADSTRGGGPAEVRISSTTRPLDFGSAWVVDPVVERYGLVYDITDFSATLSRLGRAEKAALEQAFRMTSSFQRRITGLAASHGLRLEKYLGDGAFYSGRNTRHMLVVAIRLQRLYPEFLSRGFPFDSGLRIALNYGEYRLLPLAGTSSKGPSYEFFGHGLVELSRLSTGKKTQEVDDFKTYLITQGYPEPVVQKFFAPMMTTSAELVSKLDEARRFYAYINQNGALINEGIVATEAFIQRLGAFSELFFVREAGRGYIVLELEEEEAEGLWVGIRKLGVGKFKGLEPMPVYEVIDGGSWPRGTRKPIPSQRLMSALERLFASTVTASSKPP